VWKDFDLVLLLVFVTITISNLCDCQLIRPITNENISTTCVGSNCDFHLNFDIDLEEPFPKSIQLTQSFMSYEDSLFFTSAIGNFKVKADRHWSIVDANFEEYLFCACPSSPLLPVTISPCNGPKTYNDISWEIEVSNTLWNDCPYTSFPAKCCYTIRVTNEQYWEVYTGLSVSFQNIDLGFNGKKFPIFYYQETPLIDLNVTLLGVTNKFYPFEDLAVLIDVNGAVKVVQSNMVNNPEEHFFNKLGWWKQSVEISKFGFTSFPSEIAPMKMRFKSNLNPLQIKNMPPLPYTLIMSPIFKQQPGLVMRMANIITSDRLTLTTYYYNAQNRSFTVLLIDVDDVPQRVCVSFPMICVCQEITNYCLPIKGKVKILLENSEQGSALIDGSGILRYDVFSNLQDMRYLYQPPKIRLNIKSNTFVPPIMLNSADPYQYNLYNDSKVGFYCVFKLYKYPSRFILQNNQTNLYVNVKTANTSVYVKWNETDRYLIIYDQNGRHELEPIKIIQQFWNITNSTNAAYMRLVLNIMSIILFLTFNIVY
jgi:hypothetical protein